MGTTRSPALAALALICGFGAALLVLADHTDAASSSPREVGGARRGEGVSPTEEGPHNVAFRRSPVMPPAGVVPEVSPTVDTLEHEESLGDGVGPQAEASVDVARFAEAKVECLEFVRGQWSEEDFCRWLLAEHPHAD